MREKGFADADGADDGVRAVHVAGSHAGPPAGNRAQGAGRTSGNYKVMTELFNMPAQDYKRFLGFLRKYHCHMPFQQFRSAASSRPSERSADPDAEIALSA
jgi:hypothetical protein